MSDKKPIATLCLPQAVHCLRCGRGFVSNDRKRNRVCRGCSLRKT